MKIKLKVELEKILSDYAVTKNLTHTAKNVGLSVAVVKKHINRAGILTPWIPRIGTEHWHWKGGLTSEIEKMRHTDEYFTWRRMVFARDGFKCQMPGCETAHDIHAHHIKPIADDASLSKSIGNGITLCRKCHEKTYGHEQDFIDLFMNIIAGKIIDYNKFADYISGREPEEARPCACGCGKMANVFYGKAKFYVLGHHRKGKRMSDETKKKLRASGGFFKSLEIDCNKIKELYCNGSSCYRIANELKISNSYVIKKVKDMGLARTLSEAQRLRFAGNKGI